MAERRVNKSAAIRALYADNPKMPVKLAVAELAKDGIAVAPNLVYFVLGGATGKAKRKAGQKRRAAAVVKEKSGNISGMTDPVTLILELKAMAERAGGIANLKRLVDLLVE